MDPKSSPAFPSFATTGLILAYGAGTLVSQVLLLQELLVLAQGQELKLALGLWSWLIWTGLGSLFGDRLARGFPPRPAYLGGLLGGLGWLLPATLLVTRTLPTLAPLPWGQSLPPGLAFFLFLALLAPFCLVSGCFFPWACRVLGTLAPRAAIGRVYCLEALGAALGVSLLQLLFLGRFANLALALGTGLILTVSAWWLGRPGTLAGRLLGALGWLGLGAALVFSPRLESLSRQGQWPGQQVVATVDSPYGLLTATREAEQFSFFANKVWHFSYPDPLNAEQAVHLALLEHPRPRRVLLLGGGVTGLAPEILKTQSVIHLDYVELDPYLVRLAEQVLPASALGWGEDQKQAGGDAQPGKADLQSTENRKPKTENRVSIIYQDARRLLTQSQNRYDVILLNLPEPRSAQLNRYYTREFFAIAARHLAPGGVFSFSLPGTETSLSPLRAAYLALAYHTLGRVFPDVLVLPGDRARFLASNAPGVLISDLGPLMARMAARHLHLTYVREYYLAQDLSQARRDYLTRVLAQQPAEINTDLDPRCYFYDLVLSGMQEGFPLKDLLLALKGIPAFIPWGMLALATLGLTAALRRRPGPRYLYQVLVMGLGTMGLEVLALVLYQINLGSLYRQMGTLIAAFMLGMAAGGFMGTRLGTRPGAARWLAGLQLSLAALAVGLALALSHQGNLPGFSGAWPIQAAFALILALGGMAGGGVFALSAALWTQARPGAAARGGVLYAVDLLGATLGTLGISLVVLPVWGILPALNLVAALHAGAALVLVGARS
jgi:spermidine synthase